MAHSNMSPVKSRKRLYHRLALPSFMTQIRTRFTHRPNLRIAATYSIVGHHPDGTHASTQKTPGSTSWTHHTSDPTSHEPQPAEVTQLITHWARILVVDDEENLARLAARVLRKKGYTVDIARGLEHARSIWEQPGAHYDVLFVDIVMPDGNGLELAMEFVMHFPSADILFTTGFADAHKRWHQIWDHGYTCLLKPYNNDELLDTISQLLDS